MNRPTSPVSMEAILDYEISISLVAPLVSWAWGQDLLGRYFAWKVRRKYARYVRSVRISAQLRALGKGFPHV